jgi:c-di-GMP-binding flagellar brake protein YcgR
MDELAHVIDTPQARMQPRRHPRVSVSGKVRVVADTREGLVTLAGSLIDVSVTGCAIRVHARLVPSGAARVELDVDGQRVWLPGHIVWTRTRERAWIAGVRFDRVVPEKQTLLARFVARRRDLAH